MLPSRASERRARCLTAPDGGRFIEIEEAGRTTALASRLRPRQEAERVLADAGEGEINVVILFGAGSPALIEAALAKYPGVPLAVAEGWAEVAELCRREGADPRIVWLGPDDFREKLAPMLLDQPSRAVRFLHVRAEVERQAAFFAEVKAEAARLHDRRSINVNTLGRFEKLWLRNQVHNTEALLSASRVASLYGAGRGTAALMVAAGPSLSAQMPLIQKMQDRVVIVAVDTAVKALLAHGIQSDVVVVVDPQKVNSLYVENLRPEDRPWLVAEPSVCPAVFRHFPGRAFVFDTIFPWWALLTALCGPAGGLDLGGSVATTALDFCLRAGFDHILTVGLDLSFSGDAYHVRGTFYEERWYAEVRRTRTFETATWRLIDYAACAPERNAFGDDVWLDTKFRLFRNWFQERAARSDAAGRLANGTAGGVDIQGLPRRDAGDFLQAYADAVGKKAFQAKVRDAHAAAPMGVPGVEAELRQAVQRLRKGLGEFHAAAREALDLARKTERRLAMRQDPSVHSRRLSELDRVLASDLPGKPLLNAALQKVIHAVESGALLDPADARLSPEALAVRNSVHLYREALEASALAQQWLAGWERRRSGEVPFADRAPAS